MTSRSRSALIAAGVGVGIVVLFLGTVWIFMATLGEEGLPTGGPRVAVVEIEGIIVDGSAAVRELRDRIASMLVGRAARIQAPRGRVREA